uniref:Predicted C2 domain protein n=1 Tax=Trypanosoma congolense (strain IL3000) TaxID=1068625 RepID=G0V045_TRYCI|nr:predicted C2 domain protein [Trypanosoma congolense IL3000]
MATLKVTVHEARDLPVMDRTTGLADTYVVVKLNDIDYTTEIVHMTCNPVWNRVFRLDTPDLLVLQEDPLEVRVYDHDIFSRDDIVGHTFVDCNSMVLKSTPSISGWFPLFDTSTAGIRGEIRLTLRIKFYTAENPLAPRLPKRCVWQMQPQRDTKSTHNANTTCSPNPLPPSVYPCTLSDLEPLPATRGNHPSLTTEEEGILIFSVWRLDPSVYRVESMLSMVEELIVKADPEHSKLTNLRSTRSTNEARIIQLYKLSGKVRRQLARKVVEMHCNAVLGYVEEFDMESNGIIVRAYGTPCVLSVVTVVNPDKKGSLSSRHAGAVKANNQICDSPVTRDSTLPTPLQMPLSVAGSDLAPQNLAPVSPQIPSGEGIFTQYQQRAGVASVPHQTPNNHSAMIPAASAHENNSFGVTKLENTATDTQMPSAAAGTRTTVLILTVKDLPCGMIKHIGGHISAMSVKIVAKMKSRHLISQERDAWWRELREELKANALAFHCNAIMGYEETVLYHEDVAVLSLFGTAVMLDMTLHPLRSGPELLYQLFRKRFSSTRACSLLHAYARVARYRDTKGERDGQFLCNVCHSKLVPEVLLTSCAMPQELTYTGNPRLVQAVVTKEKSAVRGVGLALAVSQALPYIEYSLHKQLLFSLKVQKLNAVFGIRVSISISHNTVIGTLTGTGCCLAGLPVPSPPRVQVSDPALRNNDAVVQLKAIAEQRSRSRHGHSIGAATTSCPRSVESNVRGSFSSRELSEERGDDFNTSTNWCDTESPNSSCSFHEACGVTRPEKTSDYIVRIDDEEEAEMMLGMSEDLSFEDSLLVTVPYLPESTNVYCSQGRIVLNTRFTLPQSHNGVTSIGTVSQCFADAKRSYAQTVSRAALRRSDRSLLRNMCVTSYACDCFFEPNSGDMHIRMEGCLMTCTTAQLARLTELGERSIKECTRRMELHPRPASRSPSTLSTTSKVEGYCSTGAGAGNNTGKCFLHLEPKIFSMSNAPYTFPYVFRTDAPPAGQWWDEANTTSISAPSSVFEFYRDNTTRRTALERKLKSAFSVVTGFISGIIKPSQARANRRARAEAERRGAAGVSDKKRSDGYLLHQVTQRIPANLSSFETSDPVVVFTSQDFVAGQAIKRYVGRLSQHFIREAYEVDNSKDLGIFFQQTEIEIQCMVQAMVILMGGNALLKHRVTYHEVWDSDGSGCASLFATVTGDVVETCAVPLVQLVSEKDFGKGGESPCGDT